MIKLLLADDHALIREGLKQIFALVDDIQVEAEVSNGNEVLEVLQQQDFDILLLDMNMPGLSGVNLISRVSSISPSLPILVLTMHNEPQIAKRAINAGVQGYLTKDSDPEVLIQAVRTIVAGADFIDPILEQQFKLD